MRTKRCKSNQAESPFVRHKAPCRETGRGLFSTIGFGDISPVGNLKYLTGLEALTGLVLITWTASFLFIEMQKHWKRK